MTDATPYAQAELLMRALPHMQRYDDATIVVKYGGHAMGDPELALHEYNTVLELDPNRAAALYGKGLALIAIGKAADSKYLASGQTRTVVPCLRSSDV